MRHTISLLKLYLLMLIIGSASAAFGNPVQELQAAGHLQIDSELLPDKGIVPGQKVTLTLEIATNRWFTGGTRITIPEVPGLVILQTEQFANNSSETRSGDTWVIQRWTLDVFPQRAGEFTIPSVPLQLQVNAGDDGDAQGQLFSPPLQFTVDLPPSLADVEQWVAAPKFSVNQSFDKPLENLSVGDAFEQEVLFEATDVLAMMLPDYKAESQPGLADYPSPPVLKNMTNRGESLASRSIRISYIAEQPGQYILPARDYFWWNTQTAKLELLSLPETRFEVGGVSSNQKKATSGAHFNTQQLLTALAGLVVLVLILRLAFLYMPRLPVGKLKEKLSEQWRRIQALRKPALATHLNPGSNAEE